MRLRPQARTFYGSRSQPVAGSTGGLRLPTAASLGIPIPAVPTMPSRRTIEWPVRFFAMVHVLAMSWVVPVAYADDPEIDAVTLSSFTRFIQPLLLNHCATGACHGGNTAAAPRLRRGPVRGLAHQPTTLANLQSITTAVNDAGGSQAFLHQVVTDHEQVDGFRRGSFKPLSAHERELLETWLALSMPSSDSHTSATQQTVPTNKAAPVSFESPLEPELQCREIPSSKQQLYKPNRFRNLLERAANPPWLPPPRMTKGLDLENLQHHELSAGR